MHGPLNVKFTVILHFHWIRRGETRFEIAVLRVHKMTLNTAFEKGIHFRHVPLYTGVKMSAFEHSHWERSLFRFPFQPYMRPVSSCIFYWALCFLSLSNRDFITSPNSWSGYLMNDTSPDILALLNSSLSNRLCSEKNKGLTNAKYPLLMNLQDGSSVLWNSFYTQVVYYHYRFVRGNIVYRNICLLYNLINYAESRAYVFKL